MRSKIKQGPHAPYTKRPPSATFVHVEHTRMAVVWERVHDLIEQNHGKRKQRDCNRLCDVRHCMVADVMEQT